MAGRILRCILLFPLRALVSAIGWLSWWMESLADWLVGVRGKTEYVRQGKCNRCGRCCHLLGLELPDWLLKRRFAVHVLGLWHDRVMNFEPSGREGNLLVYRCRYFRDQDGQKRCSVYPFRHRLCRFYPRQGLYGRPLLYDACGFRFVKREVLHRRCDLAEQGALDFQAALGHARERSEASDQYRKADGVPEGSVHIKNVPALH